MGNLRSVAKALEVSGARVVLASDPDTVESCDKLCVPGQGIFGRCVTNLALSGLDDTIRTWVERGRPYLGICLGMQVLFESSEERGPVEGLGILRGVVSRLSGPVRVPHIGWNEVNDQYFYFDHSYAVQPLEPDIVSGWCEHGERFAASIETGSILGVQFHPEKSAAGGLALLEGWVAS